VEERTGIPPEALAEWLRPLVEQLVREELARRPRETASPDLSVPEAADYLRCERQRIYDLLSDGRLTRHKDGSRVLVARADLERHLDGPATMIRPDTGNGPRTAPTAGGPAPKE
jgi:excisionase family DNA binding protein